MKEMRPYARLWFAPKSRKHKAIHFIMKKNRFLNKYSTSYPIQKYILRRLLYLIPVLLGVTLLTYALMYISPQGPVEMMLQAQGTAPDAQVVEEMKIKLGLDKPFIISYLSWLFKFICGDMGVSYIDGAYVADKLAAALPNTLILTVSSVILTIVFSIPLGMLSAVKKGTVTDNIIRFLSFIGNSLPNFILSLLLLYFLSLKLGLFPVLSTGTAISYVLPTLALAIPMTGKYIRQVRSAILEQLGKLYVEGARSRGLSEKKILFSYVLPNALHTLMTLMALSIGSLLGGTAAVEMIFTLPGMGYMITNAVISRDYPVILAFVVFMSLIYILINLLTDIISYYLDPRLLSQMEATR